MSYASLAHVLLMLDESEKGRMRRKFDLCYLLAKKDIAFKTFVALNKLEAHHDVDMDHAYKTTPSVELSICVLNCGIPTSAISFKLSLTNRTWLYFCSEVTWLASYNHLSVTEIF